MSSEFQQRLRHVRTAEQRIVPDAAWVRATRNTLVMQVRNTLPSPETVTLRDRIRGAFRAFAPRDVGEWVHRPLFAVLSLLVVLTGGSVMSVSAAEQALPGDVLYTLKLATEQARLAFTPVKAERLKLKTEFTARRVSELRQVADDSAHPDRVQQVAEILKRDLDTLKQQLNDVVHEAPAQKAVEVAKLVDQKSAEVMTALQETKPQLSPENKEKVTEAQSAAADTSVKAIEVLAEQHQQSNEVMPAEDLAQVIKDHVQMVAQVTTVTTDAATASTTSVQTSSTVAALPVVTSSTLAEMVATSTLAEHVASSTLPSLIDRVKDVTTQAFAQQKAQDQLEVAAAAAAAASSTGAVAPVLAQASSTTSTTVVSASNTASVPLQASSTSGTGETGATSP